MIRPPPGVTSLQYLSTVSAQGPVNWAYDGRDAIMQASTVDIMNNNFPNLKFFGMSLPPF
jgi:hypothetical protein